MKLTRKTLRKIIIETVSESRHGGNRFKGEFRAHPSQFDSYDSYRDFTRTGDPSLYSSASEDQESSRYRQMRLPVPEEDTLDVEGEASRLLTTMKPFVDYDAANDDSDGTYRSAGALPAGWAANGEKPFFFMTSIGRDNDPYPSVYTRYRPSSEEAARYQAAGIKGVWYNKSRYGIGSFRVQDIAGLNKHAAAVSRMPDIHNTRR